MKGKVSFEEWFRGVNKKNLSKLVLPPHIEEVNGFKKINKPLQVEKAGGPWWRVLNEEKTSNFLFHEDNFELYYHQSEFYYSDLNPLGIPLCCG